MILLRCQENRVCTGPPGVPRPVITLGTPPNVDIYINDGRNGEYPFQPVHWPCTGIWNRLASSAWGGGVHETSVVGQTNFAYVRVQNQGTRYANNVVVHGYSANPKAGLSWPDDWTPMDTPQVAVSRGIALGAGVVVGPFCWTLRVVGHERMLEAGLGERPAAGFMPARDYAVSGTDSIPFVPCSGLNMMAKST